MADITQIQIGTTYYNIKDANAQRTIPYIFKNQVLLVKNYFTAGSGAQAIASTSKFDVGSWGRVTLLNVDAKSKSDVVSGQVGSINNYGNHADQELLIVKSGNNFLIPYTTVTWTTYNEYHNGYFSAAGRIVWCASSYWGANHTWSAGTTLSFNETFINTGAYSAT